MGDLDAVGLLAAIARGDVSAGEVVAAAADRARRADARLNAVAAWVDDPLPLDPSGEGPLAGLPTFVKDNEGVVGLPMRHGSRATSPAPVSASSAFVTRLLDLGFTPLGTSAMPEFGLTASTEPLLTGPTLNPWDTSRSTGGSSGGAAALVAAGVVPIAHANDGGGSIRIPASCCGLVGLKPSRGRLLAPEGHERLPVAITAQGVLTRTVRDTALFYREMERRHPSPGGLRPIGPVDGPGRRPLRIAYVDEGMSGMPVAADVRATVGAAARLCAELGHHVEEIGYPFGEQFGRDFLRYWAALAFTVQYGGRAVHGAGFDACQLEPFTLGLSGYFRSIAVRMPATILRLRRFADDYESFMADYDVLLTPVLAHAAPPIGYLAPDLEFATHMARLLRYASFTMIQNVSGAPAMSLPLGMSADGLPIGVQVAGRLGTEGMLIGLAFELEQATAWA